MKPVVIVVIAVFVLLLVFGEYKFLYKPCGSPFQKIGERCCIDKKGNGICDDEEETVVEVCMQPLERIDDKCCLDENNNGICDETDMIAKCSKEQALDAVKKDIGEGLPIPFISEGLTTIDEIYFYDIYQSKYHDFNWVVHIYVPEEVQDVDYPYGVFRVCVDKNTCEVGKYDSSDTLYCVGETQRIIEESGRV